LILDRDFRDRNQESRIKNQESLREARVIPIAFEYVRATSLDDALAKLTATNGDGKFIAGGHSVVPLMKLRLSEPKVLIDIGRIPGSLRHS
jgi:CO/xanthine dehydrogenase FAD-binding subunit